MSYNLSALQICDLLTDDYLFFNMNDISWNGTHHMLMGLQVNAQKSDEIPDVVANIGEVSSRLADLFATIEADGRLIVARESIEPSLYPAIREGNLTGITLLNLMTCSGAFRIATRDDSGAEYLVSYDDRLARGIPRFYEIVSYLIEDIRAYEGQPGPFQVAFEAVRLPQIVAYLGTFDGCVNGALYEPQYVVTMGEAAVEQPVSPAQQVVPAQQVSALQQPAFGQTSDPAPYPVAVPVTEPAVQPMVQPAVGSVAESAVQPAVMPLQQNAPEQNAVASYPQFGAVQGNPAARVADTSASDYQEVSAQPMGAQSAPAPQYGLVQPIVFDAQNAADPFSTDRAAAEQAVIAPTAAMQAATEPAAVEQVSVESHPSDSGRTRELLTLIYIAMERNSLSDEPLAYPDDLLSGVYDLEAGSTTVDPFRLACDIIGYTAPASRPVATAAGAGAASYGEQQDCAAVDPQAADVPTTTVLDTLEASHLAEVLRPSRPAAQPAFQEVSAQPSVAGFAVESMTPAYSETSAYEQSYVTAQESQFAQERQFAQTQPIAGVQETAYAQEQLYAQQQTYMPVQDQPYGQMQEQAQTFVQSQEQPYAQPQEQVYTREQAAVSVQEQAYVAVQESTSAQPQAYAESLTYPAFAEQIEPSGADAAVCESVPAAPAIEQAPEPIVSATPLYEFAFTTDARVSGRHMGVAVPDGWVQVATAADGADGAFVIAPADQDGSPDLTGTRISYETVGSADVAACGIQTDQEPALTESGRWATRFHLAYGAAQAAMPVSKTIWDATLNGYNTKCFVSQEGLLTTQEGLNTIDFCIYPLASTSFDRLRVHFNLGSELPDINVLWNALGMLCSTVVVETPEFAPCEYTFSRLLEWEAGVTELPLEQTKAVKPYVGVSEFNETVLGYMRPYMSFRSWIFSDSCAKYLNSATDVDSQQAALAGLYGLATFNQSAAFTLMNLINAYDLMVRYDVTDEERRCMLESLLSFDASAFATSEGFEDQEMKALAVNSAALEPSDELKAARARLEAYRA